MPETGDHIKEFLKQFHALLEKHGEEAIAWISEKTKELEKKHEEPQEPQVRQAP